MTPFLDPVTKSKVKCVSLEKSKERAAKNDAKAEEEHDTAQDFNFWTDLRNYIKEEHLEYEIGGKFMYKFDKDAYWEAFSKIM